MPDIAFQSGFGGSVLAAAAAGVALLIAAAYWRAFGALGRPRWAALLALRLAAVLLVLLLLFRPVLSFQREIRERPHLVFLVDRSASMSIAERGDGVTRWRRAAAKVVDWLGELQDDFQTHVLTFAGGAEEAPHPEELPDLEADGEATSLSAALEAAASAAPSGRLGAVLLLSDGLHNSAGDPLAAARAAGARVHAIGVGDSLRAAAAHHDARLVDLDCPDQMVVDSLARVTAFVDAVGMPNRVITLQLLEDDQQVAEQRLVVDDAEGTQEVAFDFTPAVKGIHRYAVVIEPQPDETIVQNNERSASALVTDARIRVLYVEGTLRAEYGAVTGQFLAKDPTLEFCALVQTRPNVFAQRTNIPGLELQGLPEDPELIASFDVVIIGDLDSSYWKPPQLERIRQRVLDGGGLVMIGGYHSLGPGGYAATPLADILPVQLGDRNVGQATEPFQLQLTAEGRAHPIFANIADYFPSPGGQAVLDGLPPLEGCARVGPLKPGAVALAVHPSERTADGEPMPVLAVQQVGGGRTAVFAGDTTRNWRLSLLTMNQQSPFLRFWGQLVRWLAGRAEALQTEPGVEAMTDKSDYLPEAPVTITALVRGKEGKAAADARVVARVRGPDGQTSPLTLSPVPGPAGNYRGQFRPPATGRYEIVVEAETDAGTLRTDPLTVRVGRPSLEYDRLELDDRLLARIAQAAGGRYVHLAAADQLIQRMQRELETRRVQYELEVARPPLFWLLLVAVLTTEWTLRRKWRLR